MPRVPWLAYRIDPRPSFVVSNHNSWMIDDVNFATLKLSHDEQLSALAQRLGLALSFLRKIPLRNLFPRHQRLFRRGTIRVQPRTHQVSDPLPVLPM